MTGNSAVRMFRLFAVSAMFAIIGCQSVAELPPLQRHVVNIDDFRLEMKWCSVSSDRNAACELEVTSLSQDKKAGLAYPKMQDSKGKEYRLKPIDTPVGGRLMAAGIPHTFRFEATNLPSYVTGVRSVVGTFVAWLPNGTRVLEKKLIFGNIPDGPGV